MAIHHLKNDQTTTCGLPVTESTEIYGVWTSVNCPACWEVRKTSGWKQAIANVLQALDAIHDPVDDTRTSYNFAGNIHKNVIRALKAQLDNPTRFFEEN